MKTSENRSTAGIPSTIVEQRKALIAIEREIKERYDSYDGDLDERLEHLLCDRKNILDSMFKPSTEAMRHFERVNSQLTTLLERLHNRIDALKRSFVSPDLEFDEFIFVDAWIKFEPEPYGAVINLSDNGYYGSDFQYMLRELPYLGRVCPSLYTLKLLYGVKSVGKITFFEDSITPINTPPIQLDEATLKEIEQLKEWRQNITKREESIPSLTFNGRQEFQNIKISKAVYELCDKKYYAIADVLRMNCFLTGLDISIQNYRDQRDRTIDCEFH